MQNQFSSYQFNYIEYKKRTSNNTKVHFSILFLMVIILSAVFVFIKPIKTSDYEFYFVKVNSFSTYTQANNLAQEIQNLNGAGYIHLDKKYHVIVNFYENKKDAEKVIENLKESYSHTDLYTIETKKFKNIKNFSKNQNKSVEKLSNFTISLIKNLASLSIEFDKNILNFNKLSTKFNSYLENYNDLYNEFINQFKTNSKQNVSKEYANNIKTNLQTLCKYDEQNLKTNFKYLIVDTVINYCSFLSSF